MVERARSDRKVEKNLKKPRGKREEMENFYFCARRSCILHIADAFVDLWPVKIFERSSQVCK